jgi:CO/xanthine dehydrogenase Mo-binding subunit
LSELWVVGKPLPRADGLPRVLGTAKYAADIWFSDTLYAKVLRSPHPHARIIDINTERARLLLGVHAVLTAKDIPGSNRYGTLVKDQPILAEDVVRFVGEPVALVAAVSEEVAVEALRLIDAQYEPLRPVFTIGEAMTPDAPCVHEDGNVGLERKFVKGDIEAGFADADAVVENTYRTGFLEHACIETEGGIARWEENDSVTVWCSTQNPHYDREEIASALNTSLNKVRIVQAATGGGFGGKLDISVQCHLALLAQHTRRAVKMVYDRQESFAVTTKRHPMHIRYKSGATREGRLTAAEVDMTINTGAYASYGPAVLTRSCVHATGPYQVPNVKVKAKLVFTNNPVAGAMRGFGVPQVALAHESQMDALAAELHMDPLQIRIKNALTVGSSTITGQVLQGSVGARATLLAAAREANWNAG